MVEQSGLFDEDWYITEYPDVAEANINPLLHYLCHGADEGRNPSPKFHTDYYLWSYPDVAESTLNPLVHYIKFGRDEGRSASSGW